MKYHVAKKHALSSSKKPTVFSSCEMEPLIFGFFSIIGENKKEKTAETKLDGREIQQTC